MGFAASLFDENSDEVEFWRAWNSMPREDRRNFRRRLATETGRVLKKGDSSVVSARKSLALWVKANVTKPTRDRARRGRGRR